MVLSSSTTDRTSEACSTTRRRRFSLWSEAFLVCLAPSFERRLSVESSPRLPGGFTLAGSYHTRRQVPKVIDSLNRGQAPKNPRCQQSGKRNPSQRGVINLNVAPWISAEAQAGFYRELQRSLLGRGNRSLSERNVIVFRFVIAHLEPHPDKLDAALEKKGVPTRITSRTRVSELGGPSWRTLLEHWNRTHPGWEYADVRLFPRDFYRAQKAISQPYPR